MRDPFSVRYFIEVPIPRRRDGVDGLNLTIRGELPFVPQIGMFLEAVAGDDHHKVEEVHWSSSDRVLDVFFKFGQSAIVKAMLRLGWRDADQLVALSTKKAAKRQKKAARTTTYPAHKPSAEAIE